MHEIVNNFLLAGDKFMPKKYLKQPGFTYSACGPFTKIQNYIYKKIIRQSMFSTWCGI